MNYILLLLYLKILKTSQKQVNAILMYEIVFSKLLNYISNKSTRNQKYLRSKKYFQSTIFQ